MVGVQHHKYSWCRKETTGNWKYHCFSVVYLVSCPLECDRNYHSVIRFWLVNIPVSQCRVNRSLLFLALICSKKWRRRIIFLQLTCLVPFACFFFSFFIGLKGWMWPNVWWFLLLYIWLTSSVLKVLTLFILQRLVNLFLNWKALREELIELFGDLWTRQ